MKKKLITKEPAMEVITKENYKLLYFIANKQFKANRIVNALEMDDFCQLCAEWVVKYKRIRHKFTSDCHFFSTVVRWVVLKYCLSARNRERSRGTEYWTGYNFEVKLHPDHFREKGESIMDTSALDKLDLSDVYHVIGTKLEGRLKYIMEAVLDGYSQDEIADEAGISRVTVGRDYRAAIEIIKMELR